MDRVSRKLERAARSGDSGAQAAWAAAAVRVPGPERPCVDCGGTGDMPGVDCTTCDGTGRVHLRPVERLELAADCGHIGAGLLMPDKTYYPGLVVPGRSLSRGQFQEFIGGLSNWPLFLAAIASARCALDTWALRQTRYHSNLTRIPQEKRREHTVRLLRDAKVFPSLAIDAAALYATDWTQANREAYMAALAQIYLGANSSYRWIPDLDQPNEYARDIQACVAITDQTAIRETIQKELITWAL